MPKPTAQTATGVVKKAKSVGGSVQQRITPVDQIVHEYLKMLIYGRSKTGKTTFWTTFPKPILAIICSGGNKSGELKSIPKSVRVGIDAITVQHPDDIEGLVEIQQRTGKYKTMVLDHGSGLQDKVLANILGVPKLPAQMGWGVATQQQYGQCTLQCKEYLRSMLDLDCHTLIIAQERNFSDGKEMETDLDILPTIGAGLAPSLAGWLNASVDYICQTYLKGRTQEKRTKMGTKDIVTHERVEGTDYCMRIGPHEVFTTGFRLERGLKMPDTIVNPTYKQIQEIIAGQWKGKV